MTTTHTCGCSSTASQMTQLAFQLGSVTAEIRELVKQNIALSEAILAALQSKQTPPSGGSDLWTRGRSLIEKAELLRRAWQLWRAVSWPLNLSMLGAWLARALGLL